MKQQSKGDTMSTRNLSNRILITLTPSEPNFIALQTYTPRHGRSRRFFMDKPAILSLLSGERSSLLDTDLNSYLHLRFEGSAMSCKLVWLSVDPCDNVTGHIQRFRILRSFLKDNGYIKVGRSRYMRRQGNRTIP